MKLNNIKAVDAAIFSYSMFFIISLILGFLNGSYDGQLLITLVTIFSSITFLMAPKISSSEIQCIILIPSSTWIALNLAAHAAGMAPTATAVIAGQATQAQMLGFVGIHQPRLQLPFTTGINSAGFQFGLTLLLGIAMLVWGSSSRAIKYFCYFTLITSSTALLLTDSRGAVISVFLAMIAAVAFASKNLLAPTMVILAGITYPLWAGLLTRILVDLALVRQGSSMFTGRELIWEEALARADLSIVSFIGHGYFGQVSSGLSRQYAHLFEAGYTSPEAMSTHNLFIQTGVDTGYLGLSLLICLLSIVCFRIRASSSLSAGSKLLHLSILFYVIFVGGTEACFNLLAPLCFIAFALLASRATLGESIPTRLVNYNA